MHFTSLTIQLFCVILPRNILRSSYSYKMSTSSSVKSWKEVDVSTIDSIPTTYPEEFHAFCKTHELTPPKITTGNGKALSAMLANPCHYWTRKSCDAFVAKFNIATKDSIQLFNKHSQWGVQTNSGTERGKLYILYPYCLSNKHKMRKNFTYEGTEEEKNKEIEKIKSTIRADYVDVANEQWQLGHKNPGSTNNTRENLVLQPPIQAKYRDNYIFIDTLTKIPLPGKLRTMIEKKEVEITETQMREYIELFRGFLDVAPGQPPSLGGGGEGGLATAVAETTALINAYDNNENICLDDSVDILADILSMTSLDVPRETCLYNTKCETAVVDKTAVVVETALPDPDPAIEKSITKPIPEIIQNKYDDTEFTIENLTYIADEKIYIPPNKGLTESAPVYVMFYEGPFA